MVRNLALTALLLSGLGAAPVNSSRSQSPRCSLGYHVAVPPNTTALKSPDAALSATTFQECVKAAETELAAECRNYPNAKDVVVGGSIGFNPGRDPSAAVVQVFHSFCDRRIAGESLCYDFPCVPALQGAPGCEPCPGGQRRDWRCQCAYGPGEEHQCHVDFQLTNDQWAYQSETSDLAACQSEAELAMRRYCGKMTLANNGWAEAFVSVWAHGVYRAETYFTQCDQLLKGAHLCRGSGCSRPCPEGECLWNGKCVAPRRRDGLCGGEVFCRMGCK